MINPSQRKIVVKQVLLSSREHRLKIGFDQDAGDRFPLVPLNLDLAVLHRAGHIRLNTELVKKPKDLLEYVIVHEMVHVLEPTHSERFLALLEKNYPAWREARAELNELPLSAEVWRE